MRKFGLLVLVLSAATLAVGLRSQVNAGAFGQSSMQQASLGTLPKQANPLVVLAKSKCKLKVKCDEFAPENTCKHPPCCKKWHLDKVCEPKDSGQGSESKDAKAPAKCPENQIKVEGRCTCPPGQVVFSDDICRKPPTLMSNGHQSENRHVHLSTGAEECQLDGTCGRPCGYGMVESHPSADV